MSTIQELSLASLESTMAELQQPKFRAKQLYEWIHYRHASSYDEMTNLPLPLRHTLSARYPLSSPLIIDKQTASDGTRKYVIEFEDHCRVEAVGIPSTDRETSPHKLTVCFSTQVGCAMQCAFCATGYEGFTRNLKAHEIISQVASVQRDFGQRISNVVAMGQGEPFLNYSEVISALREMNDPKGFNIGARHMTISTCGIIGGIEKLSCEPEQFTLALSLHSAIQEKRNMIMPRMATQPLHALRQSLLEYVDSTNRRITFEYLLIRNFNDSEDDLTALLKFCKGVLCHVNILPVNAIEGSPFQPSSKSTLEKWLETLNAHHIEATLRKSRGSDISGACGQLKNKLQ